MHKSTSVCKMRSFFQAGVGRDWERVLENLQRLPPPPLTSPECFIPTWDGQTVVPALSTPSQPPLEAWLVVTAREPQGGRQRALLSAGNFSPLFLDGFSSSNPQKDCLAKIRKEKKKKSATKKVTGLASLLNCLICSHLKAVVLDPFFCLHCFQARSTTIITVSPYLRRFWPPRGTCTFSS